MTPSHYDSELDKLAATYEAALAHEIGRVKVAIAGASDSSIIGVGSGGSYTTAALLCSLHERYTGRVSRPSTPLEIICNPTLAAASPVFLISAEGKNPDIVEALSRARMYSARPVHVITNRASSALLDRVRELSDVNAHVFELQNKDGYLATNSLLLDTTLIARAYGELDNAPQNLPPELSHLRLENGTIDEWLESSADFVAETAKRGAVILTYSPLLRAIAADLESKLAESALVHCQVADLRSFAHGRHLWLAERPGDCTVLSLTEPSLYSLWASMRALLPPDVPTLTMPLAGARPQDLLAGLVAQMRFVSVLAHRREIDPGRPRVPEFGRKLHYIDLPSLIPPTETSEDRGEQSKYEVLGARWPSIERRGSVRRALEMFQSALEQQTFRALVFDYDGTLCSSQRTDQPPPPSIVTHLCRLIESGVIVGIASGRGGSIQERLREKVPESYRAKVLLGLYNSGCISDLATPVVPPVETSEFLSHVTRIVGRLKSLGVPIEHTRPTHPYQVSVRFREGVNTEATWFVVADAIRQAGLDPTRVVRSKHSVDILSKEVNKAHLIAHIVQQKKVEPYEVLTMGDQGAWPGNDSSLLEHRYSLSVDVPSRRLDRGWNLAPAHKRDVDATLWYLDRLQLRDAGRFVIRLKNA